MPNGWLERSLSSLVGETRDWPEWKLQAGSSELHLAIPDPSHDTNRHFHSNLDVEVVDAGRSDTK